MMPSEPAMAHRSLHEPMRLCNFGWQAAQVLTMCGDMGAKQ